MNASDIARLRVALRQSGHAHIMERLSANVTRDVMRRFRVSRAGERRLPACRSRQLAETGKWSRVRSCVTKMLPAGLPATTGWQPVLPRNTRDARTHAGKLCATQSGWQNPRRLDLAVPIRVPANT